MADWGKRVLVGSLVGAAIGVLVGLGLARFLWAKPEAPPQPSPLPMATPAETAPTVAVPTEASGGRDEAVVLVGALYAMDGDLGRAEERLKALGLEDPAGEIARLALSHASAGNQGIATDLATLAAGLGESPAELVAYVATQIPNPTATPTLAPTSTSRPTETPSPLPSPTPLPTTTSTSTAIPTRRAATRQPPTPTPSPPAAKPLALQWDPRVTILEPPVRLVEADVLPGQTYWRLVRLEWWKPFEGGNTLLYVSTVNENAQPVWGQEVIIENGGHTTLYTSPKSGEIYGTNFPMNATLNSYQAFVGGDLPSDRVTGMGLGEGHGGADHTSFVLIFQRTTK
ncbi:hypothetical protein ACFLUM_02425 [Chloroflexota bacterium]